MVFTVAVHYFHLAMKQDVFCIDLSDGVRRCRKDTLDNGVKAAILFMPGVDGVIDGKHGRFILGSGNVNKVMGGLH